MKPCPDFVEVSHVLKIKVCKEKFRGYGMAIVFKAPVKWETEINVTIHHTKSGLAVVVYRKIKRAAYVLVKKELPSLPSNTLHVFRLEKNTLTLKIGKQMIFENMVPKDKEGKKELATLGEELRIFQLRASRHGRPYNFDNVRIKGVIPKAWLEPRLKAVNEK